MKEVPLDESDIKSCQEFVTQAMKKDLIDILFNFMQRKKAKSFGIKRDLIIEREYKIYLSS